MRIFYTYFLASILSGSFQLKAQNQIHVKLGTGLNGPYTGRLIILTQADTAKRFGASQEDAPAFAINVKNWVHGQDIVVNSTSDFYGRPLDSLKGYYKLVAILDTNTKERDKSAPGNLYTRAEVVAHFDQSSKNSTPLTLTHVFQERKFNASDSVKEVVLLSKILSEFRKENIFMKAGIVLPSSYQTEKHKTYPVVYVIPGWGGTHHHAYNKGQHALYGVGKGEEKIFVFLNPETQTPYGLHAFIDSKVNGAWGRAFIEELIPYLEKTYSIRSSPNARFLTGQSSGGYGALWLSLHFPTHFAGCWATSPDPIDFSNFTGVNLYEDKNYYLNANGTERGIFIVNGKSTTTIEKMLKKELLEGDGGQQQSFEAAFGTKQLNGKPTVLFDRSTGVIDKKQVAQWKTYDLAQYLLSHQKRLEQTCRQKIRIYVGQNDNFLLQHSAIAFQQKTRHVKLDLKVDVVKAADHFNTRSLVADQITKEIDELVRAYK